MVLTRPAPDEQGNLTVTWRRMGANTCSGWAVPDLDPTTLQAYFTQGSFIDGIGHLYGVGTKVIMALPSGVVVLPGGTVRNGATLSLRYDPARGTMHARVNGGAEVLCFTDLRSDLVPAVCLEDRGDSCAIVVRVYSK